MAISPIKGARLELNASRPTFDAPGPLDPLGLRSDSADGSEVRMLASMGRFSLEAWSGGRGAPSAALGGERDGFTALASAHRAARASATYGALTFSGEVGGGSTYARYAMPDLTPSAYALASVSGRRGAFSGTISYGALEEPEGPLGSLLTHTTGLAMPAKTTFGSGRLTWAGERLQLTAEGGLGRTQATGVWLALAPGAFSTTWRLALSTVCSRPGCATLTAEVAQPVRLERGRFTAQLADVPAGYSDPLSFSTRSFSAAPDGREIDIRFGLARHLGPFGRVQLQGVGLLQEQNRASAPLNLGLLANWSTPF